MRRKRSHSGRLPWLIVSLIILATATPLGIAVSQIPPGLPAGKLESDVLNTLQAKGNVTVFVILEKQADTSFGATIKDWNPRGEAVVRALRDVANSTQPPVLAQLALARVDAQPFWIVNAIRFSTTSLQLLADLATRPDVSRIISEKTWQISPAFPAVGKTTIQTVESNIAQIRAPEVWEQFNVRGEGIVVANIDTGVAYQHPALVMQYRGRNPDGTFDHNYNWFDPSQICGNPSLAPCDNVGHGTHTMGTIVGDDGGVNQIGVAPRAKWIAAKGCETELSCSFTALLASGQWVLAPTDLNGQNPRADLRPQVVNLSLAGGPSDLFYQVTEQNWRNAGIFPAAAAGNFGDCGTVRAPGGYPESFAVGAVDSSDDIASFSSRGPAIFFGNALKPNASAPGVNVRSSFPANGYASFDGTSVATPHVTGSVALVWSAHPSLFGNIESTFDVLQNTARPRPDPQCGPEGPPNNVYGYGIIDVFAAVSSITQTDKTAPSCELTSITPTAITVTVQDGGSGLAENGIKLIIHDNATVSIPLFKRGTTEPVTVTATKDSADASKPARLELEVRDVAGNITTCDPVVTVLEIPGVGEQQQRVGDVTRAGRLGHVRQTFAAVAPTEAVITVQNGEPGLARLRIIVNGNDLGSRPLRDNDEITVPLSASMAAAGNTITLIGHGEPGATALIVISDMGAHSEGHGSIASAPSAASSLPRPSHNVWRDRQQRMGRNVVWGNRIE